MENNLNEMQLALIACNARISEDAIFATQVIIKDAEKMENALLAALWCGMCSAVRIIAFHKILEGIVDPDSRKMIFESAGIYNDYSSKGAIELLARKACYEDKLFNIVQDLAKTENGKSVAEKYFNYKKWIQISGLMPF